MKMWFLLNDGQVSGPFEAAEIEAQLPQAQNPLIWGRHQTEWTAPDKWRKALQNQVNASPAAKDHAPHWRGRVEGKEWPPMTYEQLLKQLKALSDFSAVDIKNDSFAGWREIYSVQRLVEDLGISRRSHPRVPIMGSLECEGKNGRFTARAISISEGGLGINETRDLSIGERFRATLTSPNLFVTISATCEVVYIGNDGYAGLKFIGLPMEAKSSIIEYVNKFSI